MALKRQPLLIADRAGSVMVEFALLGPLMIGFMLAVLQVGTTMQAKNALRSVGSDMVRFAAVNYQVRNRLSAGQLRDYAISIASRPPYLLDSTRLSLNVQLAATQRVAGAKEFTLFMSYEVPSLLDVADIPGAEVAYTRPIFVIDNPG
jgi:hypothetical protein